MKSTPANSQRLKPGTFQSELASLANRYTVLNSEEFNRHPVMAYIMLKNFQKAVGLKLRKIPPPNQPNLTMKKNYTNKTQYIKTQLISKKGAAQTLCD